VLHFDDRSPDAHTIEVCISPYREVTTVADGAGPYLEEFLPGAFREQAKEAQSRPLRIWLDLAHRKEAVIGHAVRLTELDGGLYGAFAIRTGVAGDKVLAAVREGVLTGVSMKVTALRSRQVDGVTQRQRAHLVGVALVAEPAYRNAKVLGVRRGWRDDQPGPASTAELFGWELDRLEGKLRAVASECIDESTRSYTRDPRYQHALRLLGQIKEDRAEIEQGLRPQPAPGLEAAVEPEAMRPKVLRRVLSGPITIR
jgi:HK97 family phage prohead protease